PSSRVMKRRPQPLQYAAGPLVQPLGLVNRIQMPVNVKPRRRRRRQARSEDHLPVAYALADRALDLVQLGAALPAGRQVVADLLSLRRRQFTIGEMQKFIVTGMPQFQITHGLPFSGAR